MSAHGKYNVLFKRLKRMHRPYIVQFMKTMNDGQPNQKQGEDELQVEFNCACAVYTLDVTCAFMDWEKNDTVVDVYPGLSTRVNYLVWSNSKYPLAHDEV